MDLKKLLNKELPSIPEDIKIKIDNAKITATTFENKNDILKNIDLQQEVGITKFEDGSYLVSMVCPMPNITVDMISWWFWWHSQDKLRYQIWFPSIHLDIKYHKKDKAFFERTDYQNFVPNTHYPVEKIGGVKLPLRIDFTTPEEFGFDIKTMKENNIAKIICGHVGVFNNLIKHTEMAHIYKQTEDGLFLISRFWLGRTMKNKLLRKLIIKDKMAKGMAEHCCIEYRNLVEILPSLYNEYK
ncbi:MAG: DAPG hydrolase family protein [Bacilli bacterium]